MGDQLLGCVYCNEPIREKGFYCPKCGKQVKCKDCKELLEKDANACIYCGSDVVAKTQNSSNMSNPVMNVVEYHETRNSRSLRASVTDNVGTSLSGVLGGFISKGLSPKQIKPKFDDSPAIEDTLAEVVNDDIDQFESHAIESHSITSEKQSLHQDLELIDSIFQFEENSIILTEPRLKASNKIDFVRRLVVLLGYAFKLKKDGLIPRKDLNKLLTKYDLNSGAVRSWLASGSMLSVDEKAKTLKLNNPGQEAAIIYLKDVFDPEKTNPFSVASPGRKKRKKKLETDNDDSEQISDSETEEVE
ncbi:zinc ribbon domain-containing protein [uncultured Spirosoma sp.]|uniref:zinc ribbon domain-containing protein n=1 Tax=uncultured Spirosoma sp. TaxID=278208 RepID=UPI0025885A59|nr:zinc ribbon domain-containing protein [uncultured Spirosoma sp.]